MGVRVVLLLAGWAAVGTARGQQPAAVAPAPVQAAPPAGGASGPTQAPSSWPREVIILQGAADAEEFFKKIAAPDWILSRPTPEGLKAAAEGAGDPAGSIVESVQVRGTVEGDHARVWLTIACTLQKPGPAWVPLEIDGSIVLGGREGDRELEMRLGAGERWEARLDGARTHQLRIDLTAPIRINAERRTLELAIPTAAATSFDLVLPRGAYDVEARPGEPIRPTPASEGDGVLASARVSPRSPLVVSWSEPGQAGERAAPLLSAQVEIAVDVDAESVAVRSSWAIACARGVARGLQIRLEDDETVSRIQLNDQVPASGIERSEGGNLLTIQLAEPMRAGESRRLVLETRRPSSGSRVLHFSGYPLAHAGEQSGFLGATCTGPNLFVSVVQSQGLRRIDPRDLPTALKARPNTTLALQFLEQPFDLALSVEDAPPLFATSATAEISIEPDVVRNETTLLVRRRRGTLFEIEVAVPAEMKVVEVGPPDLVESATPPQPGAAPGSDPAAGRVLKIRLTPQGRDRPSFALKLSGRQAAPGPGEASLGLFAPQGAVSTSSTFVVRAGRDVGLEPRDPSLVKDATPETPSPAASKSEADPGPPPLRLQTGRNPATLDLRLERRPLTVRRRTRLAARVSRRTVEVRQETTLQVRHGALASLDVLVPAGVSARWEASGDKQPIRTEDLEDAKSGGRRTRLLFDRPVVDAASLTFQYRVPLGSPLGPAAPTTLRIPWIEPEIGEPGDCLVELSSDPEVHLIVEDPAWTEVDEETWTGARTGRGFRLDRDDAAEGLVVSARLAEAVALPPVVASRALIRSTLESEGDLRVRAWYAVDAHPPSIAITLPEGARWLRARVDGKTLERIDLGPGGAASQLDLPAESAGRPVLLDLEYHLPAASVRRPWLPPALLDGAEVLQTYWLVQVPWSQAVAGQPRGWADENEWYWDVYAWKRRPVAGSSRLIAWAAGRSAPAAAVDDLLEVEDAAHGYLFSRAGPPTPIDPRVVSRAWTVLVCSGLALAVVAGLTFVPASAPWIFGAAAAVGLLAAMFLPAGVFALVIQSSSFGVALGLLAYLGRRMALREAAASAPPRSAGNSNVVVPDTSQRSVGVGSDDSTAIRVRTSSTMDYLSPPSGIEADPPVSSRREQGLRTE